MGKPHLRLDGQSAVRWEDDLIRPDTTPIRLLQDSFDGDFAGDRSEKLLAVPFLALLLWHFELHVNINSRLHFLDCQR